jgi:hypothetical protein
MAQAASFKVFGVPVDNEGAPTEDPYAPSRRAWSQSYTNAVMGGMSPIEAEAAANVHHFGTPQPEINSEDTFMFGFGKDPSMPAIKNPEPLQISPAFGADPNQMGAVIESIPSLFGIPVQAPGIANTGAPVTGVAPAPEQVDPVPPMLRRPAEQPVKTERLSEQFAPVETSAEKETRLNKQKEIKTLEAEIEGIVKSLKTRTREIPNTSIYGPFGLGVGSNPRSEKMNNDQYEANRKRLIKLEKDLEKLKGGGVQSGQNSNGTQTIRRYNPATGAIE